MILNNTVYVITGHAQNTTFLFLVDMELVAVILIQTIAGCQPDEAVIVKVNLTGKIARQLVVSVKQSTHLR